MDSAEPAQIAAAAKRLGCASVAYTYNDPVIFLEYAMDTAVACRAQGIKSVAVTAGYITPAARRDFFSVIDATNVDLKGFTERFYRKLCSAELRPVLETLEHLVHETDVWVEITTLLIPGENDSEAELRELNRWVFETLGPDVPLHFSAFHPDFRMRDKPRTPASTLVRARDIAMETGMRYVYTGNVFDPRGQSTYCPSCGETVIARDGYTIQRWNLNEGACAACGERVAGVFHTNPGTWGSRRLPVHLG